ncbi:MAG: putative toxin-antitoxin system toxin component, PIN family [Candidatus Rokubacteria bacterium]|nr:putative toxin-antitoxin system toxin component, PIN family [Candidatus Rokubacteria bacterium]
MAGPWRRSFPSGTSRSGAPAAPGSSAWSPTRSGATAARSPPRPNGKSPRRSRRSGRSPPDLDRDPRGARRERHRQRDPHPHGTPARILAAWQDEQFAVALSPAILREVRRVLEDPRIMRRHGWTPEEIRTLVADLAAISIPAPGELRLHVVREDPSDNRYLECAVEADVDYLVTGGTAPIGRVSEHPDRHASRVPCATARRAHQLRTT